MVSALQEQNVEIPAGQLGRPPADPKQDFQITLRVVGRLSDPKEFENIILKNTPNGIVQLKDVGRAEIGAESYDTNLLYSGHEAIGIGVQQLSDANALDVDKAAKAALLELSKSFPPGIKYVVAFDTTTVVGDSVQEVVTTLEEAIVIVIIVIFFFLLDWRATIIPAVTIPVSLIGTFAFIKIFGFSINSLTLFGITLATGLVVDDAIVVIENVQRHINEDHTDAHTATSVAMEEVSSAVVATSLVLISVFVPVSFFPGTTGILYKQFSLTIAFSIAISLFNALTLSPALAAMLLRGEEHKYSVFDWTHIGWLSRGYREFAHGVDRAIHGLGTAYGKAISQGAELPLRHDRAVPGRTGGRGLHVQPRSHRLRARRKTRTISSWWCRRRRELRFPTPPNVAKQAEKILLRRSGCFRHVRGSRLFALRRQLVELRTGVRSAEADRRPQRQRTRRQRHRGARVAQTVRHSRSDRGGLRAAGHSGHRQLRRIPVRAAGPGPQHAAGPGQRGAQDRRRQPAAQGSDRTFHQLHRERSAATGADRPRESQGHRRADQPDNPGAGRLHGLGIRERFRLQQPFLPRLRAGRPAVPHERARPAPILRALGHQRPGAAGQYRVAARKLPGRR